MISSVLDVQCGIHDTTIRDSLNAIGIGLIHSRGIFVGFVGSTSMLSCSLQSSNAILSPRTF